MLIDFGVSVMEMRHVVERICSVISPKPVGRVSKALGNVIVDYQGKCARMADGITNAREAVRVCLLSVSTPILIACQ
jgi:hypothetical protein